MRQTLASQDTHNIDVRLTPERIFTGKQSGRDENADKDEVGHDGVTLEPVAKDPGEEGMGMGVRPNGVFLGEEVI